MEQGQVRKVMAQETVEEGELEDPLMVQVQAQKQGEEKVLVNRKEVIYAET